VPKIVPFPCENHCFQVFALPAPRSIVKSAEACSFQSSRREALSGEATFYGNHQVLTFVPDPGPKQQQEKET
jgi:hypothetical protein